MTGRRSRTRVSLWPGFIVCLAALSALACRGYDTPSKEDFDAFLKQPGNAAMYRDFVQFLEDRDVMDVVPPDQLLRQGTDWRKLGEPAFAMPPKSTWPHIVPVLQLLRAEIIPALGPVEVVSGYRTATYNRRARGASGSRHLVFNAVDVIPRHRMSKTRLHEILLSAWEVTGRRWNWGLGLYAGVRFHVDTGRYRRW